jgi:hypothetical protein
MLSRAKAKVLGKKEEDAGGDEDHHKAVSFFRDTWTPFLDKHK